MQYQGFEQFNLSEDMLNALKKKGFENPTPIQEKTIPLILDGNRDFVGMAQTGTGKTAAFGIPIIERIKDDARAVQVLVLTPTRELAIQVAEELSSLRGTRRLQVMPIYGGQSLSLQLKRLQKGVDIVVGTPGRVMDHLRRGTLNLSRLSYVVLDEADEMLNMGFIDDVKTILSQTATERTTLLFSATMPREIVNISRKFMKDHEVVKTVQDQVTTDLTDQIYFEVAHSDKFEALCRIIDYESEFYGLVFCRTKVDVETVANHLMDRGYEAEALHGDISQVQREKILRRFKNQQINILVATDVAARGIDIINLTHVINYAIPQDAQSYVHRIGRTGRAGNEGTAITFITPREYRSLMAIQKIARADIRKEKLPKIQEVINAKKDRIRSDVFQVNSAEIEDSYRELAREIIAESNPETALAALLRHTFADSLNPENYNEIRDSYPPIQGKTRLFIGMGKRDRITKRKLVSMIKSRTRIDDRKINNVQVMDTYSFVSVPFREAELILKAFKKDKRGSRPMVEVVQKNKR